MQKFWCGWRSNDLNNLGNLRRAYTGSSSSDSLKNNVHNSFGAQNAGGREFGKGVSASWVADVKTHTMS